MQAKTPAAPITRTAIRVAQYHALTKAIRAVNDVANDLDDAGLYTDAAAITMAGQALYNTQAKVAMLLSKTGDLDLLKDGNER